MNNWRHTSSYDSGHASSSYTHAYPSEEPAPPPLAHHPGFDIIEWHPAYQSCQRYFLDHAQHEPATQALCALINIRLPFQALDHPVTSSAPAPAVPGSHNYQFGSFPRANSGGMSSPNHSRTGQGQNLATFVSLVPYVRRLVVTAFDKPAILHGFFGDDYVRGILPHIDCERRNYLFAAKHGGWRTCKKQYDQGSGGGGDETVPFLKPLDEAKIEELTAAEKSWSAWLAMEDWMVGPRAPQDGTDVGSSNTAERQGGPSGGNQRSGNPLPDGLPDHGGEARGGSY
ncbi:hypothetical protein LTR08_007082 [Meristemomyces frigidus]|nr:hypothetical protein LTR08_007082 [Meristemomyces frigidus]